MKPLPQDLELLKLKNISLDQLQQQLDAFAQGFPYLKIEAPATVGHGITRLSPEMQEQSVDIWEKYLTQGHKIVKFVPASGAASRMFKDLYAFLEGKKEKPDNDFMRKFFSEIENFAFFPLLNKMCTDKFGMSIGSLIEKGRYKEIVKTLLDSDGMNYGSLPKALLEFHKKIGGTLTPLEEQMAEGADCNADKNKNVHLHFTVSEEHLPLFKKKLEQEVKWAEHLLGVHFDITLSVQKPSTDTVAATSDNQPFRENGILLFRPGGHGALIENLNEIDADIVFIKNIDNVVPRSKRDITINYKKILGGVLAGIKIKLDEYCRMLSKGTPDAATLESMIEFSRKVLCISHDNLDSLDADSKAAWLFAKFNRPTRVCGMVRNEGEPGGGPFMAFNPDGTVSPQILESTQIDPENKESQKMLKESTHFNPVDLVCAIRNFKGEKFNLPDYVDRTTGFISIKSRAGVELKALELPGLWNGAMSDWNTILVEVPAETFNPVKTVNDLLRAAHLG